MAAKDKVDSYLLVNQKHFPAERIPYLKEKFYNMSESQFELVISTQLKDPVVLLVVSLLLGSFGVDRFMLGNIGYGILKLLLCWLLILTIVDWFLIMKKTREYNFQKISLIS